jgi:hypothetical protein
LFFENDFKIFQTFFVSVLDALRSCVSNFLTEDEVIKAAKNLKNSKAPGLDDIINEYLKTTVTKCLPYYVKIFQTFFVSVLDALRSCVSNFLAYSL